MSKTFLCALASSFFLAGCEVPVMIAADQNQGRMSGMFEITFPAVMLVQLDDGSEEFLTGELLGHANGNAKYALKGPKSGNCSGSYTKKTGINTITCDSGFTYQENVGQQRSKMSGVNIAQGIYQGVSWIGALGWGNDATESSTRAAIAAHSAG